MTSGKYDPDFVAGIWRLFDLRVALDNINPVIEAVFGLIGKKVAHLPARTTLMMMSGSRLPACQVQIAEVIACNVVVVVVRDVEAIDRFQFGGWDSY